MDESQVGREVRCHKAVVDFLAEVMRAGRASGRVYGKLTCEILRSQSGIVGCRPFAGGGARATLESAVSPDVELLSDLRDARVFDLLTDSQRSLGVLDRLIAPSQLVEHYAHVPERNRFALPITDFAAYR